MNIKEFHITDLPPNSIFIILKEDFHKKLFDFIGDYRFKNFNLLFFNNRLNYNTYKQWKSRKHFFPLWFIIEIHNKFPNYFYLSKIENNIKAYKGPSVSSVIENPSFPLKEDQRMVSIVGHFLGDGHINGAFGTNLPKGKAHSEYRNFSKDLLESFKVDLNVFGEVPTSVNYDHGHVIVPNSIGYILVQFYNFELLCKHLS